MKTQAARTTAVSFYEEFVRLQSDELSKWNGV